MTWNRGRLLAIDNITKLRLTTRGKTEAVGVETWNRQFAKPTTCEYFPQRAEMGPIVAVLVGLNERITRINN